jgi:hypothetical protein
MTTLAVDQDEHLVRPEPAQRRRPHGVGAVRDRGPWEVERWRDRLDHLRRFGIPARGDLFLGDDVDRHGLLGLGPHGSRADGHLLSEAQVERNVHRQRRCVDDDSRDLRGQAKCLNLHLDPIAAHQRARHLERVPTAGIRGRGCLAAHHRHHRSGYRQPVRMRRHGPVDRDILSGRDRTDQQDEQNRPDNPANNHAHASLLLEHRYIVEEDRSQKTENRRQELGAGS